MADSEDLTLYEVCDTIPSTFRLLTAMFFEDSVVN